MTEQPSASSPETQLHTEGVAVLTGDPKRAIVKISAPIMVAMLFQAVYNLADAVWVAGLGADALAAVGFITPVFMIIIGLGVGLGAGVTSAVARRIGAGDKAGADSAAMHGIVIILLLSIFITLALVCAIEPLVLALGAGATAGYAIEYGGILFGGLVLILFADIAYAIFAAEGSTRKTMYAMGASAALNIVLDPIFIYWAGMGIAGAAWATLISIAIVCAVLLYWLFSRRDTYVTLGWKRFTPSLRTAADIFSVGIPASLEFVLMSCSGIIINGILVIVAGSDAVAVYTGGYRIVFVALIPIVAISIAGVSVTGAAFGARRYDKLGIVHSFAVRFGILIACATGLAVWLSAPYIAQIFSCSAESMHLAAGITVFLMTICFSFPFIPAGMISTAVFEGTGRGFSALILEFLRNMVFIVAAVWVLAICFGFGEAGVWWGIVAGNILGGVCGYLWVKLYISRLQALKGSPRAGVEARAYP